MTPPALAPGMSDMAEDRVYADRADGAVAYVAAETGVVAVSVAGERVGRFRIDRPGTARDVAADGDRLVVATPEDVLVGSGASAGDGGDDGADLDYEPAGFGPAVAVGVDAGDLVAAGPDGAIGRLVGDEWFEIADIDHEPRAVDGALVAAADGVYRADPDGLDHVGLDDARDVAAAGPYAATGHGLYELGNGWIRAVEGSFDAVAAARGRAHAAGDRILARSSGEWHPTAAAVPGRVAGIAHAGAGDAADPGGTYAVTADGTVLASASDGLDAGGPDGGWRSRTLGVDGVGGVAVPDRP